MQTENQISTAQIFKGGMPYAPDLRRLNEAFPVSGLKEGALITHQDLEGALDLSRQTQRYYGVINAWIRKQRNEHGIVLVWEPTKGVKVLDPAGILNHAERNTRQKAGQMVRASKLFAWVQRERLDATGQKRLDHQMRVVSVLAQAAQSARKEMAIDLAPIKSLPKRVKE